MGLYRILGQWGYVPKALASAQLAQSSWINDFGHIHETPIWPAPWRTEFNFPGSPNINHTSSFESFTQKGTASPPNQVERNVAMSQWFFSLWPPNQVWGSLTQLETVSPPWIIKEGRKQAFLSQLKHGLWGGCGHIEENTLTLTHSHTYAPTLSSVCSMERIKKNVRVTGTRC